MLLGLAVGVGELGRGERLRHREVDALDLGDGVADRRGEAAGAAERAADALHDEVALEARARPPRRSTPGPTSARTGMKADEGDADHERRGGGRRALRAAGGVLDGEAAGDAATAARHGVPADPHARPGEDRPDDDGGDEEQDRSEADRRESSVCRRRSSLATG